MINWHWLLMSSLLLVCAEIKDDVRVNKCCEGWELYVGKWCTHASKTNETPWHPNFTSEHGAQKKDVQYEIVTGLPDCGSKQQWPILHYTNSQDVLHLLPNGVLRHYMYRVLPDEEDMHKSIAANKDIMYHDYEPGKYCMEKKIDGNIVSEYALVCSPEQEDIWTNTEFLMRNIINPITHAISMICLLIVAIIYFIMPTLRDLVGNIVTTICMCLITSQAADMARLLTVFSNHISLIITETICYISLLGAFFWLNSLGYYIWKTFKSRNVYLRITDGKKYCYYSVYAWCSTLVMGVLAVCAHFMLDYPQFTQAISFEHEQESIGSLGMTIFFVPIAIIILINIFFFVTTLKLINRMNTYGRIHLKLKHSFRMFLLLFIVMSICWLFFMLSFTKFEALTYCHIIVNAIQSPLVLYISVFNQRHVCYLLRKTCCYTNCVCPCCRPEPECEWGDEMTAMNTGMY